MTTNGEMTKKANKIPFFSGKAKADFSVPIQSTAYGSPMFAIV